MSGRFQTPRGTKDILPDFVWQWHYLERKLRDIFRRYNFREIRTPIFEDTELFARGIGATTDIVQKEMYTFQDKGGKQYTLRPEMTAPVMRAVLQHNLMDSRGVQKLYYISPMFRQERPQAGRLRQFHQYGVEIIGTTNPFADVEVLTVGVEFLREVGLTGLNLKLNSVGCPVCRPGYKVQLQKELEPVLTQLCSDCQHRFHTNPLRILDCKKETCRRLTENIPPIDAFLCEDCRTHFQSVKEYLEIGGIPYELDPRLVRGLDYYTKTAFEIVTDQLGAQDAICGGGRYDLLAEEIGGEPLPGVGFAAGMERLIAVMEKLSLFPPEKQSVQLYLIGLGEQARQKIYQWATELRRAGVVCELDFQGRSLKAQMREANKFNADYALLVGDQELQSGRVQLKRMSDGSQKEIPVADIVNAVLQELQA